MKLIKFGNDERSFFSFAENYDDIVKSAMIQDFDLEDTFFSVHNLAGISEVIFLKDFKNNTLRHSVDEVNIKYHEETFLDDHSDENLINVMESLDARHGIDEENFEDPDMIDFKDLVSYMVDNDSNNNEPLILTIEGKEDLMFTTDKTLDISLKKISEKYGDINNLKIKMTSGVLNNHLSFENKKDKSFNILGKSGVSLEQIINIYPNIIIDNGKFISSLNFNDYGILKIVKDSFNLYEESLESNFKDIKLEFKKYKPGIDEAEFVIDKTKWLDITRYKDGKMTSTLMDKEYPDRSYGTKPFANEEKLNNYLKRLSIPDIITYMNKLNDLQKSYQNFDEMKSNKSIDSKEYEIINDFTVHLTNKIIVDFENISSKQVSFLVYAYKGLMGSIETGIDVKDSLEIWEDLLTNSKEISFITNELKIDMKDEISKLFQEVKDKDIDLDPTKEEYIGLPNGSDRGSALLTPKDKEGLSNL